MFVTDFKDIAHYQDTITCEIGDFKIVAEIVEDPHSQPTDFPLDAVKRWENSEWCFCGLVLHVYVFDTLLDSKSKLYGLELNINAHNNHLRYLANDLLVEALVFTVEEFQIVRRQNP